MDHALLFAVTLMDARPSLVAVTVLVVQVEKPQMKVAVPLVTV